MNNSQARLRVQSSRFARHPDKLKADFVRPQEVPVTGRSSQAVVRWITESTGAARNSDRRRAVAGQRLLEQGPCSRYATT